MPGITKEARRLREIVRMIRELRENEGAIRASAPSRSTGIRNAYKAGYDLLEEIERLAKK